MIGFQHACQLTPKMRLGLENPEINCRSPDITKRNCLSLMTFPGVRRGMGARARMCMLCTTRQLNAYNGGNGLVEAVEVQVADGRPPTAGFQARCKPCKLCPAASELFSPVFTCISARLSQQCEGCAGSPRGQDWDDPDFEALI